MHNHTAGKIILYLVGFVALAIFGMATTYQKDCPAVVVDGVDYAAEEEIIIDVQGEVKSAGKYSVPKGTPVHDVLYMAGGLTSRADASSVDVGALLTNDCTITVGQLDEYDGVVKSKLEYSSEAKCNINTATASQLTELPGIGDALAEAIENHRKVNGLFERNEDLKQVDGIGDKIFENIKNMITVGD